MTWEQAERGWLIYALGGGWGHLQRALSLARIAGPIRILTNSRYAEVGHALACPKGGLINLLLVDTFPRGLLGELVNVLPKLTIPKILIHRDLNPRYVAQTNLRQFVLDNYDLVLVAGEPETAPFADLPIARQTAPWLIRSFD
jgi:hypothetical protein